MSKENVEDEDPSTSNTAEQRRSTVPHILPHQRSFEKRYSLLIHRQILETSINKQVLDRQMKAFFGSGASIKKETSETSKQETSEAGTEKCIEASEESATTEAKVKEESSKSAENQKSTTQTLLERRETLDIAEKSEVESTIEAK